MLCVCISGPSYEEALSQIESTMQADLYEMRLDLFDFSLDRLKELQSSFNKPIIFTLRSKSQGGKCFLGKKERLEKIKKLAFLGPDYIDLERNTPKAFIKNIKNSFPKIKIILSYHNFDNTPKALASILALMQKTEASYYKIACQTNSSLDAFRLLFLAKDSSNVITIGMGEKGALTRILAPIVGMDFTYCSTQETSAVAPGQLSIGTLVNTYHSKQLSPTTKIYGIIGNPLSQSISDITHNAVWKN